MTHSFTLVHPLGPVAAWVGITITIQLAFRIDVGVGVGVDCTFPRFQWPVRFYIQSSVANQWDRPMKIHLNSLCNMRPQRECCSGASKRKLKFLLATQAPHEIENSLCCLQAIFNAPSLSPHTTANIVRSCSTSPNTSH